MVNVCICVHRQKFIALADKAGSYIAIHFPHDNPPGWSWGKSLSETKGAGKEHFWLNFTADGEEYDTNDDIKVKPSALTFDNYTKSWALVTKEIVDGEELATADAESPPAAL